MEDCEAGAFFPWIWVSARQYGEYEDRRGDAYSVCRSGSDQRMPGLQDAGSLHSEVDDGIRLQELV